MKKELWAYKVSSYSTYFLITFNSIKKGEIVHFDAFNNADTTKVRSELFEFLKTRVSGLIGYGNNRFDYQLLHRILSKFTLNVAELDVISNSIMERTMPLVYDKEFLVPQLDLQLINRFASKDKRVTLGEISIFVKYRSVLNRPHADKMYIHKDDVSEIKMYSEDCTEVVKRFHKWCMPMIDLRRDITKKNNINVMNKPDNDIGYSLFLNRYLTKTGKKYDDIKELRDKDLSFKFRDLVSERISFSKESTSLLLKDLLDDDNPMSYYYNPERDKPDKEFKKVLLLGDCELSFTLGSLHSINKPSQYQSDEEGTLIDIDFSSFFPKIIDELEIYPSTLGMDFLHVYRGFIKDRLDSRIKSDRVGFDLAKKALNSIYGLLGYGGKPLCSYKSMLKTTINGQLLLLMLMERLCDTGAKLISVCTDGCTLKVLDQAAFVATCDAFKQYVIDIELKYEEYKSLYMCNVNEYLAIRPDGSCKRRGASFNYNEDPSKGLSFKIIPKAICAYFEKGIDYKTFIQDHIEIFDFCGRIKIDSRFMLIYEQLDHLGYSSEEKLSPLIRYYISNDNAAIKKRSLKIEGNELYGYSDTTIIKDKNCVVLNYIEDGHIKHFNVDYSYYIQAAGRIISAIENVQLKLF